MGVSGTFYTARPFAESAIQHFAAGMIFAAVAGGLIPQLVETGLAWVIVLLVLEMQVAHT